MVGRGGGGLLKSRAPRSAQSPEPLARQKMGFKLDLLLLLTLSLVFAPALADLVISKVDRRVDLISQIVRVTSTLKVENEGNTPISSLLLAFPDHQAKNLAFLSAVQIEGKGKSKRSTASLPFQLSESKDAPPSVTLYSVSLPKELAKGESFTLEVLAVFTHVLKPFPEEIRQDSYHLVLYQDTAHCFSPYAVRSQSLSVKLPDGRIESFTKLEKTKTHGSEIKYGPYENLPPFSYSPIVIHFEDNQPFAVAQKLVREIEISHWGNVQITEHYNIINGGARITGEFSRLDFQSQPRTQGATAFNSLVARLPPGAHSVYYRDEVGNISTSHLRQDPKKIELEIGPRFPLFGGWKTFFTIGYGLPLKDFLYAAEGKRFLSIPFGSSFRDLLVENLIVKVVLPEGSRDFSVSAPFEVKQSMETKLGHLDISGRPVVVLEKTNVVPEHYQLFQVYYKFNSLSLLREPFMLISGFFLFFVACIVYMHADITISKTSASYLAKLQTDEMRTTVQQIENIMHRCIAIHDKLEETLHELSRTGNVQTCKAARKTADGLLKELSKELKQLLASLQSTPVAAQIVPKVEELVAKEKELQERLLAKHAVVVEGFERKLGGREIENRVAPHQQKITVLKQEVDELLAYLDEI